MKISLKYAAQIILLCMFTVVCSDKKQVVKRTEALYNIYSGINRIISSGKKVSLYIHTITSEKGCSSRETGVAAGKAAIQTETGNISQQLLKRFSGRDGFSLVDRGQVPALIREMELKQTGFLSDEARSSIGRLLSVNYIIELSYVKSCADSNMTETRSYRMIELDTGRVISIDKLEVFKHYNDTMENWETDTMKLNRREVIFDDTEFKYYY